METYLAKVAVLFLEVFSFDSVKNGFPKQIATIRMWLCITCFEGSHVDFIIANSADPDEIQQTT